MTTPICDFVKKYASENAHRFHMPGHKGATTLGVEAFDITEIDGAGCLSSNTGVIGESRKNACELFGANTFYSTEGSSLSIRAMIYLAVKFAKENGLNTKIVAGRNAHKSFLSACALSGVEIDWLYPSDEEGYISCNITAERVQEYLLSTNTIPCALYLTSPDYLGNVTEIDAISRVCKENGILLLVDNAHGAYLKFLSTSLHPIDHGADMCADSAHKTLPCITGGGYLHVRKDKRLENIVEQALDALSLFGTTSPSFLILQSLDALNNYLYTVGKAKIQSTADKVADLKSELIQNGFSLVGNEPFKITIRTKPLGYTGVEFNEYLKEKNIVCDFYDEDYLVLMLSSENTEEDLIALKDALISLEKKQPILTKPPRLTRKQVGLSCREAILSHSEKISVKDSIGRIVSTVSVACPPAIPIVVCGEIIDQNAVENFNYYKIEECNVVKK